MLLGLPKFNYVSCKTLEDAYSFLLKLLTTLVRQGIERAIAQAKS